MTSDLFSDKLGSRGKPRCYTTHKELKFGKTGVLVGASCGTPRDGFDIYIGLDWGMEFHHHSYPWETNTDPVIEFQFRITDMSVPKSPKEFKKMITWVCSQLHDGKRIHVGCVGGHGRTGLFIAAVRAEYNGDKNSGQWVRENHCVNAIESKTQINFLFKHYGIKKIKPSKIVYTGWVETKSGGSGSVSNVIPFPGKNIMNEITHLKGKGSIWG